MMVAAIPGAPDTAMEESTVDDGGGAARREQVLGAPLRTPSLAAGVEPTIVLTFADFYDQNRDAVVAVAYGLSRSGPPNSTNRTASTDRRWNCERA